MPHAILYEAEGLHCCASLSAISGSSLAWSGQAKEPAETLCSQSNAAFNSVISVASVALTVSYGELQPSLEVTVWERIGKQPCAKRLLQTWPDLDLRRAHGMLSHTCVGKHAMRPYRL